MKVNDLTIHFKCGKEFTMQQNDWESASDPICMQLVDYDSWYEVAKILELCVNDYYEDDMDEDEFDDFIWAEYERIVLEECRVFYYEDMTDTEYMTYNKLSEDEQDKFAEKVYERIKNEAV